MARRERDKGVKGEREVRHMYEEAGATLRGLEGSGDWLAFGLGTTHHVETKRQEVARPWQWFEQAANEAPVGTMPVVAFRRSRSPWLALLPLAELLRELEWAAARERELRAERDRLEARVKQLEEWRSIGVTEIVG